MRGERVASGADEIAINVVAHAELRVADVAALRRLFDAEYQQEFGPWSLDAPYGYAPHEWHIVAWRGDNAVGHVGWSRRAIGVGEAEVVVAGVGGVLVDVSARGHRLGGRLMSRAVEAMKDEGGVAFGYLGCREEVAPFYAACGWSRICAAERAISRAGQLVFDPPGQPLFVLPIERRRATWPEGEVDLRGRAW